MLRRYVCLLLLALGLGAAFAAHVPVRAAAPVLPTFNRFRSAHLTTNSITDYDGEVYSSLGFGELRVPDRAHFVDYDPESETVLNELFIIDDTLFIVDEITGGWDALRGPHGLYGSQSFEPTIDPTLVTTLLDVTEVANQTINGVLCRHYVMPLDAAALLGLPSDTTNPDERAQIASLGVQLDLWIGVNDGYVRQVQQLVEYKDLSVTPTDVLRSIQILSYSRINEPVTITPPFIDPVAVPPVPDAGVPIYPPRYPFSLKGVRTALDSLQQHHNPTK